MPDNPDGVERFLNVTTTGTVPAHDQFPPAPVEVVDGPDVVTVPGKDFRYTFDEATGAPSSMRMRSRKLLRSGPALDAWRAPISNEIYSWGTAEGELWRAACLTDWRPRSSRSWSPSRRR